MSRRTQGAAEDDGYDSSSDNDDEEDPSDALADGHRVPVDQLSAPCPYGFVSPVLSASTAAAAFVSYSEGSYSSGELLQNATIPRPVAPHDIS